MFKLFISLLLTFSISGSEAAQLRCHEVYTQPLFSSAKEAVPHYAEALDELNAKYNNFLFKNSVLEIAKPDLEDASLIENIQARYKARKLRKILVDLHSFDQELNPKAKANVYALEKIAANLEKLTFLMDDTVLKSLSFSDRIVYKQLQHSLLSHGLSKILFTKDISISPSQTQIIISKVMAPFKKVYLRWLLSPVMMPRMDGAVIPYDVIEKVVWNGFENSKDLLAPYLKTTKGKYGFNVFSSSWNWMVAAMIFTSTATWVYTTSVESYEAYHRGVARAEVSLKTTVEFSNQLATKDLSKESVDDILKTSIERYQAKFGNEPTAEEVEMLRELAIARAGSPRQ